VDTSGKDVLMTTMDSHDAQMEADQEDYISRKVWGICDQCGGTLARIRGRDPTAPSRTVCPTCLVETLERLINNDPQENKRG
jgi:hypothetical protein